MFLMCGWIRYASYVDVWQVMERTGRIVAMSEPNSLSVVASK